MMSITYFPGKNAINNKKEEINDMLSKRWFCIAVFVLLTASAGIVTAQLSPEEELGKKLFFDTDLSTPPGQSCAACHDPAVGYTGPDSNINNRSAVYEGAFDGRFGNRKPPSAAYAGDSQNLTHQAPFIGGMFWDGRATGWILGDPLAEQAQGPFLNPLEQNNPNARVVVGKVLGSSYKTLFKTVCGKNYDVNKYYECIGRSIAAYERSTEVSPFTSRYDEYLDGNSEALTEDEIAGLALFEGKGKCANCHVPPLFTDFTYDNLGVPKNLENPFYDELKYNPMGSAWIDEGLGGFLKNAGYEPEVYENELGKMKVPTLRNVDKRPNNGFVKAYGHNGYFKSLKEIVHFYNTRDAPGADWPAPEVSQNVNKVELGNLSLTTEEESDIVAFLKTLSDE